MSFEAFENDSAFQGGGAGIQSAQFLSSKGLDAVVTGLCGPNAVQTLSAAGIELFAGYGFRPRDCRGRNYFVGFNPAVSKSALKAMSATIRSWKLQLWSSSSLEDIARRINPVIRGWLNYYGRYYRSAMRPILRQLQYALVRWAMRKYKRLRGHWLKVTHWLGRIARREPRLFASWEFGFRPSAGQ